MKKNNSNNINNNFVVLSSSAVKVNKASHLSGTSSVESLSSSNSEDVSKSTSKKLKRGTMDFGLTKGRKVTYLLLFFQNYSTELN